MLLKNGQQYTATVKLGWLERVANNRTIEEKLLAAGFSDVRVVGGGGERTASGRWEGTTREVELPSQLRDVQATT